MSEPTLTDRVTILERRVEDLASLPARVAGVELQIVQLRGEMRLEFSTVRQEMAGEMPRLRDELRAEIREGDQETRRCMRVLHEDVVARIAALSDSRR